MNDPTLDLSPEEAESLNAKRRQLGYEGEQIAIQISRLNALALLDRLDGEEERATAKDVAAGCVRWIEEHTKIVRDLEAAISAQEERARKQREEWDRDNPPGGLRAGRMQRGPVIQCALDGCSTEQAIDVPSLASEFLGSIGWTPDHENEGRGAICPHCAAGGVATCDVCEHREKIGAETTEEAMTALDKRGWRRLGSKTSGGLTPTLICRKCSDERGASEGGSQSLLDEIG